MPAKPHAHHCANCSAPLEVAVGQVEVFCEFCDSRLKIIPGEDELAVVRTREEMKYRERVAVQKAILRQKLEREEADRWRQTAAKVAIAALPIVGRSAGRGLFNAALARGGGCAGCGCLALLAAMMSLFATLAACSPAT
jgi:uncharacterized Zn finger protein (UPF0148 family)